MDLQPSETEEAIRAASEAYLKDAFPLSEARARHPNAWTRMADMGWFGISLSEDAGGIAMDYGAEALVFAELGRFLAPVGAIAGAVSARLAHAAGDNVLAAEIAGGRRRVALGLDNGDGRLRLLDVDGADLVLIVGSDNADIHALPANAEPTPCLDPSVAQTMAPLPSGAPIARVTGPSAMLHQQIAAAAFALGCAEAGRDMAVDYAKIREQFGKPIGSFQALKHIMADMAVRCSAARAQVLFAALSLEGGRSDAPFHVAVAKRMADAAAIDNGRANIQVHGGIGMTEEADPHLVLKRAHLLSFVSP
ncbi:MAG: acyl-CoA dehydrogenase family protein, partial [Sphingobium sp.]